MPIVQSQAEEFLPRQVARLAGGHYLDCAQTLTETLKLDLMTAVVLVAISRYNVEQVLQDPVQAALYAGPGQSPPAESRSPVSAYAVARELSMPYETVRRHIGKLVKLGYCARVGEGGFVLTRTLLESPMVGTLVERTRNSVLDHVQTLGSYGVSVAAKVPHPGDIRSHVARINVIHFLGLTRALATNLSLELISGLIMMAILTANTKAFREAEKQTNDLGSMKVVPQDAARQPITVYALAKSLSMPYETTRRHVGTLIERGFCLRLKGGGVLVPASVQVEPGFVGFVLANSQATETFLTALAAVGISSTPYVA